MNIGNISLNNITEIGKFYLQISYLDQHVYILCVPKQAFAFPHYDATT